jgi:hypothetical protein
VATSAGNSSAAQELVFVGGVAASADHPWTARELALLNCEHKPKCMLAVVGNASHAAGAFSPCEINNNLGQKKHGCNADTNTSFKQPLELRIVFEFILLHHSLARL